jgi:hypothetical protein
MLWNHVPFIYNAEHTHYFITMLIRYSSVIIFDMLSRAHVNTTTFNVVCQLQILGMIATRYYVFDQSMSGLQWLGGILVTGAIMSIAYSSSKEEQHSGGNTLLGIFYVACAAAGRSIAITMDSYLANRMFVTEYTTNFSAPWWLYECITFVGPASIVFLLMWSIYMLDKKRKQSPISLVKQEFISGNYTTASTFSFGEYICGVPKLTQFPLFGTVLQGLVPIIGIIADWTKGTRPKPSLIYLCLLLMIGALVLVYGA